MEKFIDLSTRSRAKLLSAVVLVFSGTASSASAQVPTLPLRQELVVSRSDLTEAPDGSGCVLTIEGASSAQYNCRVRIQCGAYVAYGAGTSGFNTCQAQQDGSLTVHDPRSDDGDPALSLVVRGATVSANAWTDSWRAAFTIRAVPQQVSGAPMGTVPAAARGREPYARDCVAQDQRGRVSVRCGAESARCERAARLDSGGDAVPGAAHPWLEAHRCTVGDRTVVAVVSEQQGTRTVLGVAPLSDGAATAGLRRVQDADLIQTAPLGALPVDPDAQASGRGRLVLVVTWLDESGAQWQSAIDTASGATRNLGTLQSCSGSAAASNDRSVCLALRSHRTGCALTHRWTMAVRPEMVGEYERGLEPFRFASIVADPLTGLLSAPVSCELPFELITSVHPNDYSAATDPNAAYGDLDDILRTQRLGEVINASHSVFAIALRAAGVAQARWTVSGGTNSIYVDHGVDFLPAPGRCPGPVIGLTSAYGGAQWLVTYDQPGGPRAEPIRRGDPRLAVNQCIE